MKKDILNNNLEYINKNLNELLNFYRYKYILVFDKKVVGSYDTYEKAANEGIRIYGLSEKFLVHFITEVEPTNFIITADL